MILIMAFSGREVIKISITLTFNTQPKEAKMKFYTGNHKFYCGIDLHARKMYVCMLNNSGKIVLHKNIKTDPEIFFELIFPYLEDIVV